LRKLTEEEIESKLVSAEGWNRVDGKWITKKFRFSSYLDGIEFVNRVAREAERLNHHPFISIEYKLISLRLTTWSCGGLSELDFTAAAEFNRTAVGE
jgi:4a-hydroxytetrahydrobiopterin dehydratase